MTQQEWEQATPEQRQEEIDRCFAEPWYFYNTYFKPTHAPEITKEYWEAIKKYQGAYIIKRRNPYASIQDRS